MSLLFKGLATIAILSVALAPTVSRADTVYSSVAAYNAATTGSTTINFNGIASPGGYVLEPNGFTLSGATFTSPNNLFILDPAFYRFTYAGGGFLNPQNFLPASLTISLPSVTAVGFDFGGLFGPSGPFDVTLSDGFSTTLSTTDSTGGGSLAFAGFTSSTDLTSITLSDPTDSAFTMDNVTFGGVSATPEPGTLGLVLTGLLGAAGAIRNRYYRHSL
jgi:hypothetical protein